MATTPKGIYYPNDYNEIADIPEDMKKMAESIDEVFENTDSDLSDIKEEQTTQNNRLNSLEVDNTTNKSDILTNKQEINNIKTEQTTQNTNISTNATNIESLQEENENLKKIVSQLPQVEGQGTEVTLENTIEATFTKFDVEGNSVQDGTPSPDNEVPILSSGDNGSINEKISNKNVWNIDKFKNLYGTNTYETYNNVECLKLAGATQRYNFDGEENTQYTFQFKLIGSTLNNEIGAFLLVYSDGTSDYHDGILTPKTYTFTSKANKRLVRIVWNAWNAGNFIYIDKNSMQLEPGSTATPYVPHEEQDYSIFVQQPMRSIGDVRDCFVKKSDGKLYERHYIGRYRLLGSKVTDFNTTYNRFTLLETGINTLEYTSKGMSNVATVITNGSVNASYTNSMIIRQRPNGGFYIYGWLDGVTSIEEAKNYLDNNEVYVEFPLAEPLDLPCTPEQVEQLENKPSTYKDFTIIQSQDETPAYLEVSGIRDIDTMFDKVTNAIVSLGGNV